MAHQTFLAMSFEVLGHENLQRLAAKLGWSLRACRSILKRASGIIPDMKEVKLF